MMWFRERREVKARRLRLSEVADSIGARFGVVLKEENTGGAGIGSSPVSLVIVTLRPGFENEIAQAQIDAAVSAGYTRPPKPPCGKDRGCTFRGQPDLPKLTIVTYPPGERISFFGPVPEGQTGVIISLS
ncbi:hypothetical protein SK571_14880 [Lentzea sp. BCCO 10_0798]|uniref:Uncharacterized protein n=1 Tax=Lentzea kristufekii TaxID=3095430 RepID=A0ABU4TQW0_9PSEU|nr:hypothetical protein [Lentzea sp. BCCO 10_0798]MDX8050673.1 hypothetical protein [Lentzea sp. BCCO 10_0798]